MSLLTQREIFVEMREVTLRRSRLLSAETTITVSTNQSRELS